MSSPFDDLVRNAEKVTAERSSAPTAVKYPHPTPCISAPVPFDIKADINPKKGEITSFLTVWNHPGTGERYVDSYQDTVEPGSFQKTISALNQERKHRNDNALCPYLWQHKREELLGSVVHLEEQSKGVVYVAQLNMGVQRAREAFALAEQKQIGSSYGYDPMRFSFSDDTKGNTIRHLHEIRLHEASLVSFPANPYATLLDAKSRYQVKNINTKIEVLASKMGASFDQLERQLKAMHSAWPDFDWLADRDQYPGEVSEGITDLLHEIQRTVRR